MKDYGRELRVADHLREILAGILRSEMRDPRVEMVSVTDVRVSRDLTVANVYVSSLKVEGEQQQQDLIGVLNRAAGFLRSAVARQSSMRTTPRFSFHYDLLVEEGPRMGALIERALSSDQRGPSSGEPDGELR